MRPRTACVACRKRQRRCIVKEFGDACVYCTKHRVACSLFVPSSSDQKSPTTANTIGPFLRHIGGNQDVRASLPMPSQTLCVEIALDYFRYIHEPTQHLFHKPTFMARVTNGTISQVLLLCVIALAARFTTHEFFEGTEPRLRGGPYAREAERHFDLHDISCDTVRTAILLGAYYGADGDSMHENIYYTIACRIGNLLRLPRLESQSELDREMDIRLWWTLMVVDVWSSNSVQLPQILRPRHEVPYPVAESVFLELKRDGVSQPTSLIGSKQLSTSILAESIKLNFILAEIADLNRASADQSMTDQQICVSTDLLAAKLAQWCAQLPSWLTHTQDNLDLHTSLGAGGAYISLYLGYYHFAQLLFYRYLLLMNPLDETVDAVSSRLVYAQQCRNNATALCETVYQAYRTPGAEIYYSMVGHVLVVASTVQLHILLFSDQESEVMTARSRLEQNFQILSKLQTMWRALDNSFGRFRSFHNACIKSKESSGEAVNEFRLDKWMVGFLMEFSRPIEARPTEPVTADESVVSEEDLGQIDDAGVFDMHQWTIDSFGIDLPPL